MLCGVMVLSQTRKGEFVDKGDAYHWRWNTDAVDSAGTFTSGVFPAFAMANLMGVTAIDTGEVDSDTKLVYHFVKRPYVIIQVDGGGSIDSASYVYLQGRTPKDGWVTIDTIATTKTTSCMTAIGFNAFPFFTELRITGAVADITVSGYDVIFYIEAIFPKLFR